MKAKVYNKIFSQDEVTEILEYFSGQPIASCDPHTGNIDKNLDYHINSSLAARLIRPRINDLIGEHNFQNGSYKECIAPYPTHIDNQAWWTDKAYTFDVEKQHECFLLIPLITDSRFRTVMFDILSTERLEMGEPMPEQWLGEKNNLDLNDFTHCKPETQQQIAYLPIDLDISWEAGDVIRWHRNQLHTSTNFAAFQLTKKFVLLGLG